MSAKDVKKGQQDWNSSGANNGSQDKALSDGQHNRGFDPSRSAERGSVSEKLNSDAAKYRGK